MLSDIKSTYNNVASLNPECKKMTESELCFKYIECVESGSDDGDVYLSALVCKCIDKFMFLQKYYCDESDYYDAVIDSISYVLSNRVWENGDSVLCENKEAPKIAIHKRFHDYSLDRKKYVMRLKRNGFTETVDTDEVYTDKEDVGMMFGIDGYAKSVVNKLYDMGLYECSVLLDFILYDNVFTNRWAKFSIKRLTECVSKIDDDYLHDFSVRYGVDIRCAVKKLKEFQKSSLQDVKSVYNNMKKVLLNDEEFCSVVKNAY